MVGIVVLELLELLLAGLGQIEHPLLVLELGTLLLRQLFPLEQLSLVFDGLFQLFQLGFLPLLQILSPRRLPQVVHRLRLVARLLGPFPPLDILQLLLRQPLFHQLFRRLQVPLLEPPLELGLLLRVRQAPGRGLSVFVLVFDPRARAISRSRSRSRFCSIGSILAVFCPVPLLLLLLVGPRPRLVHRPLELCRFVLLVVQQQPVALVLPRRPRRLHLFHLIRRHAALGRRRPRRRQSLEQLCRERQRHRRVDREAVLFQGGRERPRVPVLLANRAHVLRLANGNEGRA